LYCQQEKKTKKLICFSKERISALSYQQEEERKKMNELYHDAFGEER